MVYHPAFVMIEVAAQPVEFLVSAELAAIFRSPDDVHHVISRRERPEKCRVITEAITHGHALIWVQHQTAQFTVMSVDLAAPSSLPRPGNEMTIMPTLLIVDALEFAIER